MDSKTMIELCRKHTLYAWNSVGAAQPLAVDRAQGVYFWTPEGKRYLDFNSQLMCVNVGHSHPRVIQAIKEALDGLIYAYPGTATEARARLGQRLAELVPGDINTFFFPLGGAEANEMAIRAARFYTGRQKIIARYRSYHGATNACMQLTGDPRRWPNEPGMPGVVHVMDPYPYDFSFGASDGERSENNLRYLEEMIMYEGPHTIAAMIIETVTGTNGILPPPDGYLQALRELLNRHGILLICDEIMCGFGRTGRMFAFEHAGISPDIVTFAKGITSAYMPLGCVGVSDPIADYFREHVFWGGQTYNAHPLALNTALAAIDVLISEKMVENAAKLETVMQHRMAQLREAHPCVAAARCIGLFGIIELQGDNAGTPLAPFNGTSEPMQRLAAFFRDEGLFTFIRWNIFMCNPPLCITQAQLEEGFDCIDRALAQIDRLIAA